MYNDSVISLIDTLPLTDYEKSLDSTSREAIKFTMKYFDIIASTTKKLNIKRLFLLCDNSGSIKQSNHIGSNIWYVLQKLTLFHHTCQKKDLSIRFLWVRRNSDFIIFADSLSKALSRSPLDPLWDLSFIKFVESKLGYLTTSQLISTTHFWNLKFWEKGNYQVWKMNTYNSWYMLPPSSEDCEMCIKTLKSKNARGTLCGPHFHRSNWFNDLNNLFPVLIFKWKKAIVDCPQPLHRFNGFILNFEFN